MLNKFRFGTNGQKRLSVSVFRKETTHERHGHQVLCTLCSTDAVLPGSRLATWYRWHTTMPCDDDRFVSCKLHRRLFCHVNPNPSQTAMMSINYNNYFSICTGRAYPPHLHLLANTHTAHANVTPASHP